MCDFLILFKTVFLAMIEIFLLASLGFILVRKKFIDQQALSFLTRLLIIIILPLFIFTKIIKSFSFSLYPNWWVFPFLSLIINTAGFAVGYLWFRLFGIVKSTEGKKQLISLIGFQNSGYIPLILSAALLSTLDAEVMFIYIFLFLLGFNLAVWSFGVWFLSRHRIKDFELGTIFSPPVVATVVSLILVAIGVDKYIPGFLFRPAGLLGDCLLPISMIVVGGNLALVSLRDVNKAAVINVVIVKLVLLPILALLILWQLKPEYLMGFLLILEAAVPSATSLSLILRHYSLEDKFISHGVFFTHIVCVFTIPLFIIIYQMFAFFK
jgi:hypothetical protein